MLNGLDLFSGIGGLAKALAPWVRPAAYCEIDRYATAVLLSQMALGNIPTAPIWDDVRTLKQQQLPRIDFISGGFPCQDLSLAGTQKGLDGERSGLFFEVVRLTAELKPSLVFLENVPGVRPYVQRIRAEFETLGYAVRDGFLCAPPLRGFAGRRWFMLAAAESELGSERVGLHEVPPNSGEGALWEENSGDEPCAWEAAFSEAGRDVNGLPNRVDRLRALGNAVVPEQAREAFRRLMGLNLVTEFRISKEET